MTPQLNELGALAGIFSRFFFDPSFPDPAAQAMYSIWNRLAIARELADYFLVAKDNQGKIGAILATVTPSSDVFQPCLMATFEHMRGKELGTGLFTKCMR